MIKGLCKEVEKRMNNCGVKGSKVTLKLKQRKQGAPPPPKYLGHGSCHSLSKCAEVSNKTPTRDWKCFFDVAMQLYCELKVGKDDVRGMGVIISKLVNDISVESNKSDPNQNITKWFNEQKTNNDPNRTTRRVDFVIPTKSVDNEVDDIVGEFSNSEDIDDSSDSDILWVKSAESNDHVSVHDNDINDISLPALSQIHMSQVNALPSPMRKQIISKIENEASKHPPESFHPPTTTRENVRFRQTDVKRMFRLASVKSGMERLLNESGQAISLTQLECLPLELQLEIVNEDSNGLGPISPEKKRRKVATAPGKMESVQQDKGNVSSPTNRDTGRQQKNTQHAVNDSNKIDDTNHMNDDVQIEPPPDFSRDNIEPFMSYMDENPTVPIEAIHSVSEFLCICVTEHRLMDTVILLQCIKNRNDDWSTMNIFESIFDRVNHQVQKNYRANLDKEWILQT
jgi:hypothetical protein